MTLAEIVDCEDRSGRAWWLHRQAVAATEAMNVAAEQLSRGGIAVGPARCQLMAELAELASAVAEAACLVALAEP